MPDSTVGQLVSRVRVFVGGGRAMYHACRVDYPCEGCEMGRWASLRGAWSWAWEYMR
jgi:hypothetical protein